jgi:hypothetical protein
LIFATSSSTIIVLKTLAKNVATHLRERAFCVVFEDDLDRCWPRRQMARAEREREIKPSPNLKVGLPQLSRVGSVPGRFFEGWDRVELDFAQVAPSVQLGVVFEPALADVIAVLHVRDHDVPDADGRSPVINRNIKLHSTHHWIFDAPFCLPLP